MTVQEKMRALEGHTNTMPYQITRHDKESYRARMQIKETFRDLKNYRYGFSFRECMVINCID